MHKIESWDMCRARALARRGRRALQRPFHGGVAVAAAGWFWKRRGAWQGKKRASARQQEGEEVVRDAWVPAHGEVMAGKAFPGAGGGAVGGVGGENRAGRWEMVIRVDL